MPLKRVLHEIFLLSRLRPRHSPDVTARRALERIDAVRHARIFEPPRTRRRASRTRRMQGIRCRARHAWRVCAQPSHIATDKIPVADIRTRIQTTRNPAHVVSQVSRVWKTHCKVRRVPNPTPSAYSYRPSRNRATFVPRGHLPHPITSVPTPRGP
jgi:hypothetical protein